MILIVDDDRETRTILATLLGRDGYKTAQAADGHAAIEFVRAGTASLVLLDIRTPGMAGTEVLRVMKADPQLAHIPVIVFSAEANGHEFALALGAVDHITKGSLDWARIRAKIHAIIGPGTNTSLDDAPPTEANRRVI